MIHVDVIQAAGAVLAAFSVGVLGGLILAAIREAHAAERRFWRDQEAARQARAMQGPSELELRAADRRARESDFPVDYYALPPTPLDQDW